MVNATIYTHPRPVIDKRLSTPFLLSTQASFTVNGLPMAMCYFAITAVSDAGAESVFSNVERKDDLLALR